MIRPWIIGVISTDYDLHEYRKAIISKLKNHNVMASAFEETDFPIEPDIHSHDNCLVALERTDIVIIIIDKRYGGIYYGDSSVSITEKEYFAAIKNKIPCLVFVSEKTWQERHAYNIDLKKSGKREKEFQKQYNCKYVENVQVLHLINKIQKINSHWKQNSNWITFFKDIPDLLEKIEGKLKGLSRFWLERIVDAQGKKLFARKTSTSGLLSLGDVFRNNYYIEPSYRVKSGEFEQGGFRLHNSIVSAMKNNESVLVYGEAGYGKTTILAKCFFEHKKMFDKEQKYRFPFYLWLKNKGSDYHFNVLKYIEECFEEYLNKVSYPFLDMKSITPVFYLDGFDEIAEKLTVTEISQVKNSEIFKNPVLLTSRVQHTFRYINNYGFSDKFNICIKIEQWDKEKAYEYIRNFCKIQKKDDKYANRILDILDKNKELEDILDSPLFVTMLLWIIDNNRLTLSGTINNKVDLFQECMLEIAKRELVRADNRILSENNLVSIWSAFAWLVYRANLKRETAQTERLIAELQKKNICDFACDYKEIMFEAIFDISDKRVYGTCHEQFLEYLVAKMLCDACLSVREPYPEFLQYVVRPEINRFFRIIWQGQKDDDKKMIVENINKQYLENVVDNSEVAVSKRVHLIYHISRLETDKRKDMLDMAFKIENHISVKLSLYFGAIKMGDLNREREFFDLLSTSDQYDKANRGYHLAYYADIIADMPMPFLDDNKVKWAGTLAAFMRHFKSDEKSLYFLRRIDLLTMLQLMNSRKTVEPITDECVTSIKEMVYNPPIEGYEDFQNETEKMFDIFYKEYNIIKVAEYNK